MHEMSLLADIFDKLKEIVEENKADRITAVRIKLGAFSHISAGHFREHFEHAARGTAAENARLEIIESNDIDDPHAQDIILESVELPE